MIVSSDLYESVQYIFKCRVCEVFTSFGNFTFLCERFLLHFYRLGNLNRFWFVTWVGICLVTMWVVTHSATDWLQTSGRKCNFIILKLCLVEVMNGTSISRSRLVLILALLFKVTKILNSSYYFVGAYTQWYLKKSFKNFSPFVIHCTFFLPVS